jgi:hypothetical protein
MSSRPIDDYRDTPLWAAVEATLAELVASGELSVNTAPEYVTAFLCQELAAKRLVMPEGLRKCN